MCCTLACRAFATHTSKMKDKLKPLTHATKYAVSASKNKIQYYASSIFSIVFNFLFSNDCVYSHLINKVYYVQCQQQSSGKSSGFYAAHHLILATRKTNLECPAGHLSTSNISSCVYHSDLIMIIGVEIH
jgi:hypothetical protein